MTTDNEEMNRRLQQQGWSQEPAIPYKRNVVSSGLFDDRAWARKTDERIDRLEERIRNFQELDTLQNDINAEHAKRIHELENGQLGAKGDVVVEFNAQIRDLNTKIAFITEAIALQSQRIDNVNKMGGARENTLHERIAEVAQRVGAIEQANLQKWKEQDKREQSYPCPYCTHMALRIPAEATTYFLNHHSLENCAHRLRMLAIEKEVYAKRDSADGRPREVR